MSCEYVRESFHESGFLLVDKPRGLSSHDVVMIVRRYTNQKVGHCGTLDPFATGLLILCIGKATKHAQSFTMSDKHYQGVIRLGESRDTDDVTGKCIATGPIIELTAELQASIHQHFTGTLTQKPPEYSAIKIAGKRAYALARKGKPPNMTPRDITIHFLRVHQIYSGQIHLRVSCSKGTYIRALARDIGVFLGTRAHLESLRRTGIGRIDLDTQPMHQKLFKEIITSDFMRMEQFLTEYSEASCSADSKDTSPYA